MTFTIAGWLGPRGSARLLHTCPSEAPERFGRVGAVGQILAAIQKLHCEEEIPT